VCTVNKSAHTKKSENLLNAPRILLKQEVGIHRDVISHQFFLEKNIKAEVKL